MIVVAETGNAFLADHELIMLAHPTCGQADRNPRSSRVRISLAIYADGEQRYFTSSTHRANTHAAREYGARIIRQRLVSCTWVNRPGADT